MQKEGIHQISNINTLSPPPIVPPRGFAEPVPPDFAVTAVHRDMAAMMGAPDPESCVDAFIGHHQSLGTVSENWDGEFRKWLAREREFRAVQSHRGKQRVVRDKGNEKSSRSSGLFAERYGHLSIVDA